MRLSSKPEIPIAVPGVLLALLVTGGLWWAQSPLRSPRAAIEIAKGAPESLLGDQTIDSRLWEDPFDAVERRGGTAAPERHHWKAIAGQVHRRLADTGAVCVLAVMVDGEPYAENTESRLRSRRAVVAALGRDGYVPADANHLGYFEVPWEDGAQLLPPKGRRAILPALPSAGEEAATNAAGRLRVPFEWFHTLSPTPAAAPAPNRPQAVLVWWLREDAFLDLPLLRLTQLMASLRDATGTAAPGDGPLQFRIIGPRTSDGLLAMLRDVDRLEYAQLAAKPGAPAHRAINLWGYCPILSPWATVSEDVIVAELGANLPAGATARGFVRRRFAQAAIQFHNLVARDDQLASTLLAELGLRGVDVTNPVSRSTIVLLTEFDTLYGRALPRTFAAVVAHGQKAITDSPAYTGLLYVPRVGGESNVWPSNVRVLGYLRGLDGEQPKADSRQSGEGTGSNESLRDKARRLERAEGRGQLDTMRRLAESLRLVDRDLELNPDGRGGIAAIGLLGSDLPDKLVALQALRPAFPNALFFTTDLDARLFHPAELRWSRNLLVGSGYDLQLGRDLTRGLAPFREGYQTAQYVACLAALGHTNLLASVPPPPRIFEIGNNGPLLFNPRLDAPGIHPEPHAPRPLRQTLILPSLVALMLGVVLLAVFPALPQRLCQHCGDLSLGELRRRHGTHFAAGMLMLGIALTVLPFFYGWWIRTVSQDPLSEPFYWLEGVSVWPTELLRLLVVYLCLYFCLRTRAKLRDNKTALCQEFALPGRVRDLATIRTWWARRKPLLVATMQAGAAAGRWRDRLWLQLPAWLQYRSGIGIGRLGQALVMPGAPANPNLKALHLWEDYNALGYSLNRLYRYLPIVLLYLAAAVLIFISFDFPFVPFRGTPAAKIVSDTVPLALSVIAQLLLIFFVLDATMLCRRMIQVLVAPHVGWPRATYEVFRRRLNLQNPRHFQPWLDAWFIAQRTRVIMPLIYYPFVVIAIMIVSRLEVFDRWDWPPSLIIVTGLNAVFAVVAAFSLRQAAERARRSSLAELRGMHLQLLARPDQAAVAKQLEVLAKEVESLREGAFAPLAEQPLIRALLLPFGGMGFVALIEAFANL